MVAKTLLKHYDIVDLVKKTEHYTKDENPIIYTAGTESYVYDDVMCKESLAEVKDKFLQYSGFVDDEFDPEYIEIPGKIKFSNFVLHELSSTELENRQCTNPLKLLSNVYRMYKPRFKIRLSAVSRFAIAVNCYFPYSIHLMKNRAAVFSISKGKSSSTYRTRGSRVWTGFTTNEYLEKILLKPVFDHIHLFFTILSKRQEFIVGLLENEYSSCLSDMSPSTANKLMTFSKTYEFQDMVDFLRIRMGNEYYTKSETKIKRLFESMATNNNFSMCVNSIKIRIEKMASRVDRQQKRIEANVGLPNINRKFVYYCRDTSENAGTHTFSSFAKALEQLGIDKAFINKFEMHILCQI